MRETPRGRSTPTTPACARDGTTTHSPLVAWMRAKQYVPPLPTRQQQPAASGGSDTTATVPASLGSLLASAWSGSKQNSPTQPPLAAIESNPSVSSRDGMAAGWTRPEPKTWLNSLLPKTHGSQTAANADVTSGGSFRMSGAAAAADEAEADVARQGSRGSLAESSSSSQRAACHPSSRASQRVSSTEDWLWRKA